MDKKKKILIGAVLTVVILLAGVMAGFLIANAEKKGSSPQNVENGALTNNERPVYDEKESTESPKNQEVQAQFTPGNAWESSRLVERGSDDIALFHPIRNGNDIQALNPDPTLSIRIFLREAKIFLRIRKCDEKLCGSVFHGAFRDLSLFFAASGLISTLKHAQHFFCVSF